VNEDRRPNSLRGLIFDLDGTLGDTLPICVEAFRRAVQPLTGQDLSDEDIVSTFGPCEEGALRVLAPGNEAAALVGYLRHYEELHGQCPTPFEGVPELISFAKLRGVRLALVTGKGQGSANISLRWFGLEDTFEAVEVGSPEGPRKEEGIRRILGSWGFNASEVAYIGDSVSDIKVAHQSGLFMIAAAWAPSTDAARLEAHRPEILFSNLTDFRQWLESVVSAEIETPCLPK